MKRYGVLFTALLLFAVSCGPAAEVREVRKSLEHAIAPAEGGFQPSVKFVGSIDLVAKDRRGRVKTERHIRNLVVDAGKAGTASRINGSGAEAAFTFIAIGTGVTAAAAGDTTLQTEITTNGGARAACTASRVTTDVTNDTAQCVLTYNFTGSFAVTESGYLNASSAGVLLARQVFSAINVGNGDSLQITWKIDVD